MAVDLRQVLELAETADDGDGGVGGACEIAGQVADMRPATVFVVGGIPHVMQAGLDLPVPSDQAE